MCLYPRIVPNPKYKPNKKNNGHPPPMTDDRLRGVPIGCKNCIECRKQKAREWQVRLLEDIKTNKNAKFITLTFSNDHIRNIYEKVRHKENKIGDIEQLQGYDLDNAAAVYAVRHWLERIRKETGKSIRHWLVTELGHQGTQNIHLHGLIWTDDIQRDVDKWQNGYVWKGKDINGKITNYVNEKTIGYITKYVHKQDEQHRYYKPIILTSAGIGSNYTSTQDSKKNSYNGTNTRETYRTRSGHRIAMPIYWRNKIYNEHHRELLWLQRLDKNERWVRGERIDVSKGMEQYFKILKFHQQQNQRLGYGNQKKDWNRYNYEQERRIMLQQKRMKTPSARSLAKGLGLYTAVSRLKSETPVGTQEQRNITSMIQAYQRIKNKNVDN